MAPTTVKETGRGGSLAQRLRSSGTDTTILIDVASGEALGNNVGAAKINTGSSTEWFSYTGITLITSTRYRFDGVVRGLKKNATTVSDASAALKKDHAIGTPISLVMHSVFMNQFPEFNADNTMMGKLTLGSTSNAQFFIQVLTDAQMNALTGVTDGVFIYNSTQGQIYYSSGGAWYALQAGSTQPNASETVAGKIELSTNAEIGAGTSTGGTGARLTPPNDQFKATSAGAGDANKPIIRGADGKMDQSNLPASISNLQVNEAVNITATSTELNKLDGASANVTATNLNTLTGGTDASAMHSHKATNGVFENSTQSGAVTYAHGLGVTPTKILFEAYYGQTGKCAGSWTSAGNKCVYVPSSSVIAAYNDASNCLTFSDGTNHTHATVSSANATNFTITWGTHDNDDHWEILWTAFA